VLPVHIVFQPNLYSTELQADKTTEAVSDVAMPAQPSKPNGEAKAAAPSRGSDLSLHAALRRHLMAIYEQTGRNQRQTARVLEISRSRLARHLRSMDL